MGLLFDISQDELPIFLAEADEHLQHLDEILVHLEQLKNDTAALQEAFRAAHTLKGMAGIVGHTRMVNLTHSLETVMDRFRKGTLEISSDGIDICLDAVDGLRLLRDEVNTGVESDLDFEPLMKRFSMFHMEEGQAQSSTAATTTSAAAAPVAPQAARPDLPAGEPQAAGAQQTMRMAEVTAVIEKRSIASAARAFQLMLVLQEMGEIQQMDPSQAQIETSQPVENFYAKVQTSHPLEELQRELGLISEVERISVHWVGEGSGGQQSAPVPALEQTEPAQAVPENGAVQRGAAPSSTPERKNGVAKSDMLVRTSVERLDVLMSLVGELITDRNHLTQIRNRFTRATTANMQSDQLSETVAHLSRITDQLQEEVMRIRMLPVGNVFHKFPRLIRDLAQKTGKQIDLIIRGEDTELDRSVIEEINDPLIHLLRNAVDHGIETPEERVRAGKPERGKILLTARHEQGRIVISVEDDGKGIDVDRLRKSAVARGLISEDEARAIPDDKALELIFLSGLSTAAKVSDISGRGVGMDIVRSNIQRINGNILVDTHLGAGTQFQIILPLTLAIIPTLLVEVSGITLAIPIVMVAETLQLHEAAISTIRNKPVTVLRKKVLPLVYIRDLFHFRQEQKEHARAFAVVINYGKQQVGLVVDALMGEEEVVVKAIGTLVGDVPGVSSATILGDGSVALILDVTGLIKMAEAR